MNQQLPLNFEMPVEPTLARFVVGRNLQVHALFRRLAEGDRSERQIHLWGLPGSGKSHLLRALCASSVARYCSCRTARLSDLEIDPGLTLWCIDDVESAAPEIQVALFNLVNVVRDDPRSSLVTAGSGPPLNLQLREDLRTRLGWGLVFQLQPLDDTERADALSRNARERGLELSPEVSSYLLTHFSRDMTSLIHIIEGLDRYALEKKRAVTIPLVREWLQRTSSPHPVS